MWYIKTFESHSSKDDWKSKFEILSLKYSHFEDDFRIINKDDDLFDELMSDFDNSSHKKDVIEINSVLRISDGEVFTLGGILYDNPYEGDEQMRVEGTEEFVYGKITKLWTSRDQFRADVGNMGSNLCNMFLKCKSKT
jgi:hypothetical protein